MLKRNWCYFTRGHQSGRTFPLGKSPRAYDVICTDMSAFGSCFLTDVEFHMFKYEYNEIDHPNLS